MISPGSSCETARVQAYHDRPQEPHPPETVIAETEYEESRDRNAEVYGLRKTVSGISTSNLRSTIRNTMSPFAMLFATNLKGTITPSTLR